MDGELNNFKLLDRRFEVVSDFHPAGDQPDAIEELANRINAGETDVVLMGATGTGKTAVTAWLIEKVQRPTLIIEPNKTLAAQLAGEFREFLPNNAVEYFVSYYDYYQPEAYVPQTDTYIEKDASINDEIDRLRHLATSSLLTRRDCVVVASVSCIYGLGAPKEYLASAIALNKGDEIDREVLIRKFISVQYNRNDYEFKRGTFRVRGEILEIIPVYEELAVRIEFFGDEIENIYVLHPVTGKVLDKRDNIVIFPASHYVANQDAVKNALKTIAEELEVRIKTFEKEGKFLEAERIRMRTNFDLEQIEQTGSCSGIENYSRHFDGREPGSPPNTLLDFFPDDFLLIIDESHVAVPQIGAMFTGDMARKQRLIEYGFRLPSAADNRPLKFDEFLERINQTVYLSATPGNYELGKVAALDDTVVEQIIRPTGLLDPKIMVRPTENQIDDLLHEINKRVRKNERVLVTTLTKKMSEHLTDYLREKGIRVRYLHSDVDTLKRVELLRGLRAGDFDVLVGINLLREGLDLPEVSLVAILDADKEGFLRSYRSLIQTIGRAARNVDGSVIMYADKMTDSMKEAISETERRRAKQELYNKQHGITPKTIKKKISDITNMLLEEEEFAKKEFSGEGFAVEGFAPSDFIADFRLDEMIAGEKDMRAINPQDAKKEMNAQIRALTKKMHLAADDLQFELAARFRDEIRKIRKDIKEIE